jgi:hypothetical protein
MLDAVRMRIRGMRTAALLLLERAFGSRELAKHCKRRVQVLRLLFPVPVALRERPIWHKVVAGFTRTLFGRVARAASSRSACDSMPMS